jgi:hypothetical protein
LEESTKSWEHVDVFLIQGGGPQMPLGLAGLWGDPDIPRARLTLGLAGFSLGYIRMGILKNALGGGVPIFLNA